MLENSLILYEIEYEVTEVIDSFTL
jgi:hypothetical protein